MLSRVSDDTWVCPSDRHLSLRAKLNSGWSVRAMQTKPQRMSNVLSENELSHIKSVISRAEKADTREQQRIGSMVHRLESMRHKSLGDGIIRCILCAEEFGKFVGASPITCMDCKKNVCGKCSVDYTSVAPFRQVQINQSPGRKVAMTTSWLCKICSESREVWKRSGAWFFRSLPKYILPDVKISDVPNRYANRPIEDITTSNDVNNTQIPTVNVMQSPNGTYSQFRSIGRRRSTSSESSDNEEPPMSRPNRYRSLSGSASLTSSTTSIGAENHKQPLSPQLSNHNDEDASNGPSRQGSKRNNVKTNGKNLDVPGGRKRRISGSRGRMKRPSESDAESTSQKGDESDHSTTQTSFKDNVDMSSLHSSGVKQPAEDNISTTITGGSFIEKVDPDVDNAGPLGSLEFTVLYDSSKLALLVTIIRARNLKAMDINGLSDPYVKLHLLPGSRKSSKLRTKTKRKTLNPNFDETLTYWGITDGEIARKRLRLTVLDEDRFGQNEFIGEVSVPLRHLTPLQTKTFNLALDYNQVSSKEDEEDLNERGRALISLCFNQNQSTLIVSIVRCAGLVPVARNNAIDPQVKVCLQHDDKSKMEIWCERTERNKLTRTSNPAYNDVMGLPIIGGAKELVNCHLDVSVWDKDALGREHLIGALLFGIKSKGGQLRHWFDCIKNPDKPVEMWHDLYYPDDSGQISALAAAGKRRRTPRLQRKPPM